MIQYIEKKVIKYKEKIVEKIVEKEVIKKEVIYKEVRVPMERPVCDDL